MGRIKTRPEIKRRSGIEAGHRIGVHLVLAGERRHVAKQQSTSSHKVGLVSVTGSLHPPPRSDMDYLKEAALVGFALGAGSPELVVVGRADLERLPSAAWE